MVAPVGGKTLQARLDEILNRLGGKQPEPEQPERAAETNWRPAIGNRRLGISKEERQAGRELAEEKPAEKTSPADKYARKNLRLGISVPKKKAE